MSKMERDRHRSKGIFTLTQLSYTFRPRRTPKRAKNPAKPRYLALQALASVLETCEFNKVNVLKFLLSKETTLEGLFRMAGRK